MGHQLFSSLLVSDDINNFLQKSETGLPNSLMVFKN